MKTTKLLFTIVLFGLISFSNFAQTDDEPKAMFANYESHRNSEFRLDGKSTESEEMVYMRNLYEIKMTELNLERLAYRTEKELKYEAPSVELIEAIENLDSLMIKTLKEIKYVAPEN